MPDPGKRKPRILKPGAFARAKSQKGTLSGSGSLKATLASSKDLRKFFSDDGILAKVSNGEMTDKVVESTHPSWPLANEPFCTKSQTVEYYDSAGKAVARAHRYLRQDGSIGLSGQPDPKQILHDGVLYVIDPHA